MNEYVTWKQGQVQDDTTIFPATHRLVERQETFHCLPPQLCRHLFLMLRASVDCVPEPLWRQRLRDWYGFRTGSHLVVLASRVPPLNFLPGACEAPPRHLQGRVSLTLFVAVAYKQNSQPLPLLRWSRRRLLDTPAKDHASKHLLALFRGLRKFIHQYPESQGHVGDSYIRTGKSGRVRAGSAYTLTRLFCSVDDLPGSVVIFPPSVLRLARFF